MKVNYQLVLDKKIEELKGTIPTLLLHSCCGPCSTYVLEYLSKYFKITVVYYNPNIFPQEEYEHRLREQKKVVENMPFENPVDLIFEDYQHNDFIKNIKGLENEPEGGARCTECFRFRLEKTAELAKERKYDYFTTTLSVSPHKNSQLLNELGKEIGEKYGVEYLLEILKSVRVTSVLLYFQKSMIYTDRNTVVANFHLERKINNGIKSRFRLRCSQISRKQKTHYGWC